ncbi:hypothetical protein [Streptomyces benahoarensis]|uniref:Uncharacterized protein n=1 Tax=Streptomyces benahoarensis TaxID=2595054 RepID=A0A553ZRS0_9ACTN|nr:hypothetical protein [Streptomyces benahoarensis]TSB32738.1 hypothetical protein FNJ62_00190 [Streptomyces benahoarensis]TSB44133.1 hypothetical protein FNZ23_00525 [Streptomyces benahoarensis]
MRQSTAPRPAAASGGRQTLGFEEYVRSRQGTLLRSAHRLVADPVDAQEVVGPFATLHASTGRHTRRRERGVPCGRPARTHAPRGCGLPSGTRRRSPSRPAGHSRRTAGRTPPVGCRTRPKGL